MNTLRIVFNSILQAAEAIFDFFKIIPHFVKTDLKVIVIAANIDE